MFFYYLNVVIVTILYYFVVGCVFFLNMLCILFCFFIRYASVSCEILTADVSQVNDALGEDESLLKQLYGFLQNDEDLNPLLASFFSKVMGILINRKTEQVIFFNFSDL